jgi:glycosyltransferase involved in cell wall biosynthesis
LVIAGTGPSRDGLRAVADQTRSDVRFVGFHAGQALHDIVRGSRAVVLPSEWYENAPMSVLESFALGKPVVAARIGGLPELIDEGRTGWMFESGHVDDLARVLVSVKGMPDANLGAMGRAARGIAETLYTEDRYFDAVCSVYGELGVKIAEAVPA